MTEESRRRFNRVPYYETCTLTVEDAAYDQGSLTAEIADLSAGGFAVNADFELVPDTIVQAVFGNQRETSVTEQCTVAHCTPNDDKGFTIGFRFTRAGG